MEDKLLEPDQETLKQLEEETPSEEELMALHTGMQTTNIIGEYLNEIGQFPLLTKEQEQELCVRIQNKDQEALKRLIEHNLRLVVAVAKYYRVDSMDLMDMIQEGNTGLMKAAERFDYNKGCRFSSYAIWWIRQAITRAIANQVRTIRVPIYVFNKVNQYKKIVSQLEINLGYTPSTKELADYLSVSEESILYLQKLCMETVSLDSVINEEGDTTIGELIADESHDDFQALEKQELYNALNRALDQLSTKEREILLQRFGFDQQLGAKTLGEVGEIFGVTRERIRQIEAKALKKLRYSSIGKELKSFIEE